MPQTEISPGLVAAYRATEYRIDPGKELCPGSDRAIILCIDQYSEPLSRLLATSHHRCAAFITACNPFSIPRSHEENMAGCARLRYKLDHTPGVSRVLEGEGYDPSGTWPGEKSFLALGLDCETSQALGSEFGQNAIVWAGPDAIPRLILLR